MFRRIFQIIFVMISLLILNSAVWAQETGTIEGTVTDSTGALVPHARVTTINQATQDKRETVSNSIGFFSIPGLVSGDYWIKIQAKGFRGWEQTGIHILPGDRKKVDGISLTVGAESESVTVTAAIGEVQVTDSGDRSAIVDEQALQTTALQGQDVTETSKMLPGFANTSAGINNAPADTTRVGINGSSALTFYSANGQASGSGAIALLSDGADVIDKGCNCSDTQTIGVDMTSEVKITSSAYSAENTHGPVIVDSIGKSGTTEYHGDLYYHFRDASMDSNQAYNKMQTPILARPYARYNYPGGSFGGPVRIPGTSFNKDKKLFFWTGFEYIRQRIPNSYGGSLMLDNVPTLSERQGLMDPTLPDNEINCSAISQSASKGVNLLLGLRCGTITGLFTPGANASDKVFNSISNSDISAFIGPGAKAVLPLVPLPNTTPTAAFPYNFVQQVTNFEDGTIFHERVDYAHSDNTKLYVSYNWQRDNWGLPLGTQYAAGANSSELAEPQRASYMNRSHTVAGNLVHTFKTTLVDELAANIAYGRFPISYANPKSLLTSTLNYPYTNLGIGGSSEIPGYYNFGGGGYGGALAGGPSVGSADVSQYFSRKLTPQVTDTLTWIKGAHMLKFGAMWANINNQQQNNGVVTAANGSIFEGAPTYNPAFFSFGNFAFNNQNEIENFLTDEGGISSTQTPSVNTGYTQFGFFAQDDWKIKKRVTLSFGLRADHIGAWTDDGSAGNGAAVFVKADYAQDVTAGATFPGLRTHKAPADGLVIGDSSIPLSGRTTNPLFYSPRLGVSYDIFGAGKTVVRGGIGRYYFNDQYNNYNTAISEGGGAQSCATTVPTWLSVVNQGSSVTAANGGIACNAVSSISPVDPSDKQIPYTWTYSLAIDQVTLGRSTLEVAYAGSQSKQLPNTVNNIDVIPEGSYYNNNPNNYTIANISNNTQLNNSFRPYPAYSGISMQNHGDWSNYNALQISWNRYAATGLSYGFNYTWGKSMGIAGPDPVNIHNDYGPLSMNRPQVFHATYVYSVGPRFKSNRLLSAPLADWIVSGVTTIQSGAPMQSTLNLGLSGTGFTDDAAQSGSTTTNDTINGSYFLGSSDYGTVMPLLTCGKATKGDVKGQYFNPTCFAVPQEKQYAQRYFFPSFFGPMHWESDAAVAKTFAIVGKQNVEFRLEATNFLNHALTGFDSNNADTYNLVANNGVIATTAGTTPVGKPTAKQGQRVITVTLKYNF